MSKTILFVAVTVLVAVGCAHVESAPGHYSVSGTTTTPEAAIYAASQAYVESKNVDEYWKAVQQGLAIPYMGGAGYNDMTYWYGGGYVMPPALQTVPAPAATGSDDASKKAEEAKQEADDALKAIIEHVSKEEQPAK